MSPNIYRMTDVKSQMASTFLQGEKYLMFSKNKTQKRETNTANTALMHKQRADMFALKRQKSKC